MLGGDGAALEGVTVTGGAPGYMMIPPTCVTGQGGDGLTVRDCHVESIMIVGGKGHVVAGNVIAGGKVWLMGATDCEVRANYQHGLRWGAGIEVQGGEGHVIAENECRDDLCAIKCVETIGARVERNRYETRWFGIHLLNAHGLVALPQPGVAHDAGRDRRRRARQPHREATRRALRQRRGRGRWCGGHRHRRVVVPRLPGRCLRVGDARSSWRTPRSASRASTRS